VPIVKYGPKQRAGFELVPDDHLLAVRTRSQQSLLAARSVPDPIEAQLDNCVLVCAFADAGVEVYRAPSDESSSVMEARKQALRAHPNVRFAGSVLVVPKSREPVLYTENLFIKFFDEVAPDAAERVIRESGLTLKQKLAFSINGDFVEAIEGIGQRVFDLALNLLDRPDVQYCHPELIRPRMPKLFFPGQWHLAATRVDGVMINAHAHVGSRSWRRRDLMQLGPGRWIVVRSTRPPTRLEVRATRAHARGDRLRRRFGTCGARLCHSLRGW
jgi:hypothetical protein